ncbi:MAG: AAA family ATPase [Syntrophales bacterium LBB04]|nr:AAA family ATPase [Syntrophales bacterium LBB04]
MKSKIDTLEIRQFRALRQLKLEGLGRVNLMTGRNNTGKSSVLEALRILAPEASPSVIYSIQRFREEDVGEMREATPSIDTDGLFQLSSLFHGFPQFSVKLEPIVIVSSGGQRPMQLSLDVIWVSEERDQNGSRRYIPQQQELFNEREALPALMVEVGGARRLFPLEIMRRYPSRILRPEITDDSRLPCVFVSPYGGERTSTLGLLWDRIALSDREKDVIEALRIIDPEISAVSMIGGEGPRQTRTAIVRSAAISRPVPLRSFGDGLNRLFGIVLSLVNAKDGLLLIDEFENGLHHSIQVDIWKAIFKLASRLDIQVVATSHSWDAINAFQKAASEDPEEGVLIRLSRRGEEIIPTLFREDELAVVTRDHIEVR